MLLVQNESKKRTDQLLRIGRKLHVSVCGLLVLLGLLLYIVVCFQHSNEAVSRVIIRGGFLVGVLRRGRGGGRHGFVEMRLKSENKSKKIEREKIEKIE